MKYTVDIQLTVEEHKLLLGYLNDAKAKTENGMHDAHPEMLKYYVQKADAIDALREKIASQSR